MGRHFKVPERGKDLLIGDSKSATDSIPNIVHGDWGIIWSGLWVWETD
jgi:hypothetical protein